MGVGVEEAARRLLVFCFVCFFFFKLDLHQAANTNSTASWFPNFENRAAFGRIPAARAGVGFQFPKSQSSSLGSTRRC